MDGVGICDALVGIVDCGEVEVRRTPKPRLQKYLLYPKKKEKKKVKHWA